MQAAEILDTFKKLGITAYAEGGNLVCEPGSKLPPELVPEIRQRKAEIMALLAGVAQRSGEIDLPFPLGNGGLDPAQVAMAERSNDRLGVVDPVDRRLNVLFWVYQHYREVGDGDMAGEVKAAYDSLRANATDVVRLIRMGDHDQNVLLKRLRNGHRWLVDQHQAWLEGGADGDDSFQKALDGWVELEHQLRDRHGYCGCIHGPDQRCPADAPVRCDACVSNYWTVVCDRGWAGP